MNCVVNITGRYDLWLNPKKDWNFGFKVYNKRFFILKICFKNYFNFYNFWTQPPPPFVTFTLASLTDRGISRRHRGSRKGHLPVWSDWRRDRPVGWEGWDQDRPRAGDVWKKFNSIHINKIFKYNLNVDKTYINKQRYGCLKMSKWYFSYIALLYVAYENRMLTISSMVYMYVCYIYVLYIVIDVNI